MWVCVCVCDKHILKIFFFFFSVYVCLIFVRISSISSHGSSRLCRSREQKKQGQTHSHTQTHIRCWLIFKKCKLQRLHMIYDNFIVSQRAGAATSSFTWNEPQSRIYMQTQTQFMLYTCAAVVVIVLWFGLRSRRQPNWIQSMMKKSSQVSRHCLSKFIDNLI